jgi:hypothetical protein
MNDYGRERGWLTWKKQESYIMPGEEKKEVGFFEGQLTSKTNWMVVLAVVMAVLKQLGIDIDIGGVDLPNLPWAFTAVVTVITKVIKWAYYKFIRKSE